MDEIAVTGLGAITCAGGNVEETWSSLVHGRSGISTISRFPTLGLKTKIAGTLQDVSLPARAQVRTRIAAERALAEALEDACLPYENRERAALFLGMTGWEFEWFDRRDQMLEASSWDPGAFLGSFGHAGNTGENVRDGAIVSLLQDRFSLMGPGVGVTTACASGGSAIELGASAIRRGEVDVAIVGAADATVTPESVVRFSLLSALSTGNGEPQQASRPFSRSRDGFVMAEGAGFLVLERRRDAERRGANIRALVLGAGSNADAFHRTRSRPDGSGGARCVERALRAARITSEHVDYVNAHGTSTPENDRMETKVLKKVFGAHAYRLLISSNKSVFGHCLAAAGAVEAVATVRTIETGIIPPTLNLDDPDEELDLQYVPNKAVEHDVEVALSTSFGFGGQNVAVVFGRAH